MKWFALAALALLTACDKPRVAEEPKAAAPVAYSAAPAHWLTDLGVAQAQARAENKKILALFTGSDWCPYCLEWDKELFFKPEFLPFATNQYVLLYIDFPDKRPLPPAQEAHNKALEKKYDVEEYPMVYILDGDGKDLLHFKYLEGGFEAFKEKLASNGSSPAVPKAGN